MKPAEQSADANASLPHEAAPHYRYEHDAHFAELVFSVRRRAAAQALRTLRRRRLSNSDIRELLAGLREDLGVAKMRATWPTPREQRAIVESAAQSAGQLREALRALPPATIQRLWLEASRTGVALSSRADFDKTLLALAHVGSVAAQQMPAQARARARTGIVARVHRVASRSQHLTLCTAAFVLAGETEDPARAGLGNRHPTPTDPKGAIRAYIARTKGATGK